MTSLQDMHGLHKVRDLSVYTQTRTHEEIHSINDELVLFAVNWLFCTLCPCVCVCVCETEREFAEFYHACADLL